ncbi:MAG TPA: hypothetical protein VJP76_06400 [Candidatus Tumulicola sp.]|nr:hypothetical protein [Candidatus Tumulicola sp.]
MTKPYIWIPAFAVFAFLFACGAGAARAQDEPTPSPEPAATAQPDQLTAMDRAYDGKLHVNAAPYIWAPTLNANLQYSIPRLPRVVGGVAQGSVSVPPVNYLPKLNSAAMVAFDGRLGAASFLADFIYVNATTTASTATTITGPLGRHSIPVALNTSAHLSTAIWEVEGGFAIAHGHDADLNFMAGWRQLPVNLTLGYDATIGKRGIIAPSGSVSANQVTTDVIFGLRGKAYFGGDHWYIPYYGDMGVGADNQTWQVYGGVGYTFNHGQQVMALYRQLDYYGFPANAAVQKLSLGGPLLGYTFPI